MECKGRYYQNGSGRISVLIETLWNVKNFGNPPFLCALRRINRNIVECKAGTANRHRNYQLRINRNIVECKVVSDFS